MTNSTNCLRSFCQEKYGLRSVFFFAESTPESEGGPQSTASAAMSPVASASPPVTPSRMLVRACFERPSL